MNYLNNTYVFGDAINGMALSQVLLIALVLLFSLLAYIKLAKKWQIVDTPNERSSHKEVTIRGGGIVFSVSIVIYFLLYKDSLDEVSIYMILGALALSVLSFIDDIKDLSSKLRLGIHLLVLMTLFWQLFAGVEYNWFLIIFVFGLSVVMMNGYNFMDGINGISFQMTLSVCISLIVIDLFFLDFLDHRFLVLMGLANAIFGVFNFRKKALCFMGDIGSIVLGFVFVVLCIKLGVYLNSFAPTLVLLVYFLDVVSTMLQRLFQGENILKPHRKHLYQILVNEFKMSHLIVSSIYFIIQASVILIWGVVYEFDMPGLDLLLIVGTYTSIYWLVKAYLLKKLSVQSLTIS